jgi:hypothetical protein
LERLTGKFRGVPAQKRRGPDLETPRPCLPAITLRFNAHLLHQDGSKAAEAINAALAGQVKV